MKPIHFRYLFTHRPGSNLLSEFYDGVYSWLVGVFPDVAQADHDGMEVNLISDGLVTYGDYAHQTVGVLYGRPVVIGATSVYVWNFLGDPNPPYQE